MRVFLARLPYSFIYGMLTSKTKTKMVLPPSGMLYVASALEKAGHKVMVADCEAEGLSISEVVHRVADFRTEMFGVGSTTPEFPVASELIKTVKQQLGVFTVLGGPHGTILSKDVLSENPHIDFVVRGEGEITTTELLEALEKNGELQAIKGLSYRCNGQIRCNENRKLIQDLDSLPLPARHLTAPALYLFPDPKFGMKRLATVHTSRGCPYRCTYCYHMFGTKMRFRATERVINEIQICVEQYGAEVIFFVDDTFTLKPTRVMDICDKIIQHRIPIRWMCLARADTLREDMLLKMRQAGCIHISVGVESGNQKILDLARKQITLAQVENGFRLLRRLGFETRASFILGLPGENQQTIRETIDFAKHLAIDRANFNIFTPYPGIEICEDPKLRSCYKFLSKGWSDFRREGNAVIELNDVPREQLIEFQRIALMEFYMRWPIVWRHLVGFVRGARDAFYYRPLLFAAKEHFRRRLTQKQKHAALPELKLKKPGGDIVLAAGLRKPQTADYRWSKAPTG
ncbi:MAG: radical SAM protein [Phycisphaerae bacterium]|nr:radical SAM protein [Phycisphaerae bacterium]